jgi:hypothetical protein
LPDHSPGEKLKGAGRLLVGREVPHEAQQTPTAFPSSAVELAQIVALPTLVSSLGAVLAQFAELADGEFVIAG